MFQASLKAAAVGGIFFIWANLTKEAFNLAWHIISTSPVTFKAVTKAVCENCQDLYDDDKCRLCRACRFKTVCGKCQKLYDDDEYHLIYGTHLCEACR